MTRSISLILSLFTATACHAQLNVGKSAAQEIAEMSLAGGIYAVRQKYVLKDRETGAAFGRGGAKEFGTVYGFALKQKGKIIFDGHVMCPGKFDPDYAKYAEKYEAVGSETSIMPILSKAKAWEQVDLGNMQPGIMADSSYFSFTSTAAEGFSVSTLPKGQHKGWVVWITAKDSCDIGMAAYYNNVSAGEIKPISTNQKLLGGAFFTMDSNAVGELSFSLAGLIHEKNGQWMLCLPFGTANAGHSIESGTPSGMQGETITPVQPETKPKKKRRSK